MSYIKLDTSVEEKLRNYLTSRMSPDKIYLLYQIRKLLKEFIKKENFIPKYGNSEELLISKLINLAEEKKIIERVVFDHSVGFIPLAEDWYKLVSN